jgi:hypothetical protein
MTRVTRLALAALMWFGCYICGAFAACPPDQHYEVLFGTGMCVPGIPIPVDAFPVGALFNRGHIIYTADGATCLVQSPDGKHVTAWWTKLPNLTGEDGKVATVVNTDLRPGDFIVVSAPVCNGLTKDKRKSITNARIRFTGGDAFRIVPNPSPSAIHCMFRGEKT